MKKILLFLLIGISQFTNAQVRWSKPSPWLDSLKVWGDNQGWGGGIDSIKRDAGNDSVFYYKSGTKYFAFIDSSGTGGGGGVWGTITGTLGDQTDLQEALNAKQDVITLGTTDEYFRGDLSLRTFPTMVSEFSNDAGYITGITSSDVTTALGYTPVTNARTLTINGVGFDLSADRTWTVGNLISTNNLSDLTSASTARTNLGATTVGSNIFTLSNPSAVRYMQINSDNTITVMSAPTFVTSIGALSASTSSVQNGYFGDLNLYDDNTPSHYLKLTNADNLSADRTLSINANNTDRTISLSGDLTVSSAATISGTNTGDQTTIVGISGTKAEFNTACSDGDFLYSGDVTQYTDEMAQDATGAMAANSTFINLTYVDGTPSLTPALSATGSASSSTFLRGDNTWATASGTIDPTSGFSVHKNGSSQNIATATATLLTWSTETIDIGGEFASNKFTATNTGYYYIEAAARITAVATGVSSLRILLYKNGSLSKTLMTITALSGLADITLKGNTFINLTAADYLEIYIETPGYISGNTTVSGTASDSWFAGDRVAVGSGDAITTNPLSQFAATTSAQLRGVLSDEQGTGLAVFNANPAFASTLTPVVNDGTALGTTSLQFSDLYLAEGGVINWDNGDMTATQSGNNLTITGGTTTVDALIPASSTVPTNGIYLPDANTVGVGVNSAGEVQVTQTATSPISSDGNALGTSSLQWSDLFLASGGVINFANADATLTHSSGALALNAVKWTAPVIGTGTSTATSVTFTSSNYGQVFLWSPTGTATATLPANGAAAGAWFDVILLTNQTITISAATADTLITFNDTAADSVAFSTSNSKIGGVIRFISNGSVWVAFNMSNNTMTVAT